MLALKKEDGEFLQQSAAFCDKVEEFTDLFNLDGNIVQAFKSQNYLLNHLLNDSSMWDDELKEFVAITLENLRMAFQYLTLLCKCSSHYSRSIGLYLGIEETNDRHKFSLN